MGARTWLQGITGALFGYDFFIAYAHADGRPYAVELNRRLEAKRFECFLDSEDYIVGDDWKRIGAWSLSRTSYPILVASPLALESKPVHGELRLFKSTGRRVFAIDFEGTQGAVSRVGHLLGKDTLTLRDTRGGLAQGRVDDGIVETLETQFRRARQETKRLRWVSGAALVLALLAATAIFLAVRTALALQDVRRARTRAEIGRLASEAQRVMTQVPQQGALLAVHAARLARSEEEPLPAPARTALHATLNNLSGELLQKDVRSSAISPDSRWLAALTSAGTLDLWRLSDHAIRVCKGVMLPGGETIHSAAFTPDGGALIAGGERGTVVKAIPNGDRCPKLEPILRGRSAMQWVEISSDGRWLLAFDAGGEWLLASWPAATKVLSWPGRTLPGLSAHFDPSSRRGVTPAEGDVLCVHDLGAQPSRECSQRLELPSFVLSYAAFDPAGRRLALAMSMVMAVWDLDGPRNAEPACATRIERAASELAFSASGEVLYGGDGDSIRAWDFRRTAGCPEPVNFPLDVEGLTAVLPLGRDGIAGATFSGELITWDAPAGEFSLRTTDAPLMKRIAIPANATVIAAAGQARHVELWPMKERRLHDPRTILRPFDGEIRALDLSADGRWLTAISDFGELRVWSLGRSPTGQMETLRLSGADATERFVCSVRAGACLVTTASRALLRWDLLAAGNAEAQPIARELPEGSDLWLSPSARWLVVSDQDARVHLHDLKNGAPPKPLFVSPRMIADVQFSPDETLIAFVDALQETVVWSTSGMAPDLRPPPDASKLWSIGHTQDEALHVLIWDGSTDLLQLRKGERTVFQEEVRLPAKAWVLDGRWLLVETEEGERSRVWLRRITRSGDRVIVGAKVFEQKQANVAAIAGDERSVVLVHPGHARSWALDLSAEKPTLSALPLPPDYEPRQLSSDGRWLLAFGLPVRVGFVTEGNSVAVLHHDARRGWTFAGTTVADQAIVNANVSPDARWLAVAGNDHVVRLYELEAGTPLVPVDVYRHTAPVDELFFDTSSRYLFSIGRNGVMHRAPMDVDALVAMLAERVSGKR